MKAFPRASRLSAPCAAAMAILSAAPLSGKIPLSVLGTYVEDQDSAYGENLGRDLAQSLADDTAFLVYNLRARHGAAIDRAHADKSLLRSDFLTPLYGGQVRWGLLLECREARGDLGCRLQAVALPEGRALLIDTLHFLPEAAGRRKQLGQALVRPVQNYFYPKRGQAASLGKLKVRPPAKPAMLVRNLQVIQRGQVEEIPLGATLVLGDTPQLLVISMDNLNYILYPHSSYTYLLPKVVQLNQGTLGLLKGVDSASLQGRFKQATALDSSNLIWRNLSKLAALDSSNLIWRSLGKVTSLDSSNLLLHNAITRTLGKAAVLDSTNPLFKALGQVTSLDSSNLLLRTLSQVAALDSSNLVWKGLGQVSSLDSNNLLWRKLGQIASLDTNSIWRKLGLLAFQDSTVVLTPSFVAKGLPQAALVRHQGSVSTLEVVKGSMTALPLLSSEPAVPVGALRLAETRGYTLKQTRLNPVRGDRLLREFESADPKRASRTLAMFLPGKLFSIGASLRTADRPLQSFIAGEMLEMDMEMDVLSSEKEGWSEPGGTFRTGAQESGCYLCSPDRIGP